MTDGGQKGPSLLEKVDIMLATRLVAGDRGEPLATAQQTIDGVRRPTPSDAAFFAALLRLRGFAVADQDARDVLAGGDGRLSPVNQEFRMVRGLATGLQLVRERATSGQPPDGWFAVSVWKQLTAELPRFHNNDLRRGPPWDSVLYLNYPSPDQLPYLLDTFDLEHCYRDQPMLFSAFHPVRQGFRIMWRFARIAPFPDFNLLMGWMMMVAWLQWKGYPLLAPEHGDQVMLSRLLSGPPPVRIVQFERRLLEAASEWQQAG
ncbi:MAG: hypothetical protein KDC98_18580 [Planctomycetes bacterium]|nr:hypothetical protein [Planctomycetota bacterium]